jgi:hypothetical protein
MNKDDFYTLDDEDYGGEARVFASPRSWTHAAHNLAIAYEFMEKHGIKSMDKARLARAIQKDVGAGPTARLAAFIKLLESFSPKEIMQIYTDPDKVKTPTKAGSGFSLDQAHALLNAAILAKKNQDLTPQEFENFAKYLVKLDNPSIAASAMKKQFFYHTDMHSELGEGGRTDKAAYQKGYQIFDDKYGDIF